MKKLGFYDSGIGGLTVLREFRKLNNCVEVIYLGDRYNFPYGNKSKDTLRSIARKGIKFLVERDVDAVIIACNTLSTTVIEELRSEYKVPIIPITRWMEDFNENGDIKFIGTNSTVNSGYYQKTLNAEGIPAPNLAEYIESGIWGGVELEGYISRLLPEGNYTLVLACTHYSVIKNEIQKIRPSAKVVDISGRFANYILKFLKLPRRQCKNPSTVRIFFTSKSENHEDMVKRLGFDEKTIEYIPPL